MRPDGTPDERLAKRHAKGSGLHRLKPAKLPCREARRAAHARGRAKGGRAKRGRRLRQKERGEAHAGAGCRGGVFRRERQKLL